MNERIRELQSKSYLMCKQIVDDDGHVVVTPDKWFDTFAELLVRECAQVSEDDISDGDACCTNTADRIARQIKKRFGVE